MTKESLWHTKGFFLISYLTEDGKVTLQWNSLEADTFVVEWSTDGFLTKQVSPELTSLVYVATVPNWISHQFRIRALTSNTTSRPIVITTVPRPPLLVLSARNPYKPICLDVEREPNMDHVFEYSTVPSFTDFVPSFSETLSSNTKILTEPGTYLSRLRATNGVVSTGYSYALATIRAIPAAPILSVDSTHLYAAKTIRWDSPDSFTTHLMEKSDTVNFAIKTVVELTDTFYQHSSFESSYYRIRSTYDGLFTGYSTPVQVTRVAIPDAPTLSVDLNHPYQAKTVRWSSPDAWFTTHSLEISADDFVSKTVVELTDTSYTHTTIGVFQLRIRSTYAGLFTSYSQAVQVTRLAIPAPTLTINTRETYGPIVLTWSSTTTTFLVEHSKTNAGSLDPFFAETLTLKTKTFTEPGEYLFRVSATDGIDNSPYSYLIATITPPPAPLVTLNTNNPYQTSMTWATLNPIFNQYTVEYSQNLSFTNSTVITTNDTYYLLTLAGNYYVRIRASFNHFHTEYTTVNVTNAVVPPAPPINIQSRNVYEHIVTTFTGLSRFTHYVEYSTNVNFTNPVRNQVTNSHTITDNGSFFVRTNAVYETISIYSSPVSVTKLVIPPAPPITIISRNEYESIIATFTPLTNFTHYVEYSTNVNFTNPVRNQVTNSYTLPVRTGTFFVRTNAVYGSISIYSTSVSATITDIYPTATVKPRSSNYEDIQVTFTVPYTNSNFKYYIRYDNIREEVSLSGTYTITAIGTYNYIFIVAIDTLISYEVGGPAVAAYKYYIVPPVILTNHIYRDQTTPATIQWTANSIFTQFVVEHSANAEFPTSGLVKVIVNSKSYTLTETRYVRVRGVLGTTLLEWSNYMKVTIYPSPPVFLYSNWGGYTASQLVATPLDYRSYSTTTFSIPGEGLIIVDKMVVTILDNSGGSYVEIVHEDDTVIAKAISTTTQPSDINRKSWSYAFPTNPLLQRSKTYKLRSYSTSVNHYQVDGKSLFEIYGINSTMTYTPQTITLTSAARSNNDPTVQLAWNGIPLEQMVYEVQYSNSNNWVNYASSMSGFINKLTKTNNTYDTLTLNQVTSIGMNSIRVVALFEGIYVISNVLQVPVEMPPPVILPRNDTDDIQLSVDTALFPSFQYHVLIYWNRYNTTFPVNDPSARTLPGEAFVGKYIVRTRFIYGGYYGDSVDAVEVTSTKPSNTLMWYITKK